MASIRELAAARLKKAQSGGGGNIDYSKLKFKPETGKEYLIRILPNKYSEYPIQELEVHNYDAFKKSPVALSSFGEKDPIVTYVKKAWDDVNKAKAANDPNLAEITKEVTTLSKAIKPKKRHFAQVIIRGEEAKGAVIWEFGKNIAETIDGLLATDDYETMTDVVDGVDLVVTGIEATMQNGKKYTDVMISPKRKSSPVSKDADTVQKWLDDQKDPAQVLYKTLSYDELKQMLKEYLEPGDEDEQEAPPVKKAAPLQPAKAPVKRQEVIAEETEEEEAPFVPQVKTTVKPKAKKAPVVEEEDEEFENPQDELLEKIPNVRSTTTPVTKPKVTAKPAAPASAKKAFDDLWEEDEEED